MEVSENNKGDLILTMSDVNDKIVDVNNQNRRHYINQVIFSSMPNIEGTTTCYCVKLN